MIRILCYVGGYCNTLQYLSSLIASLDVLVSFAVVAVSAPTPYVRPKMLPYGSGSMKLKQARHPCVEMQDNISYIPNDVNFQQGKDIPLMHERKNALQMYNEYHLKIQYIRYRII